MAYTTKEMMIRIMGEDYYELTQSDLSETGEDTEMVLEIIDEAESIMDMYVSFLYDSDDLVNSDWVKRKSTWLACHLLSRRKGNPGNFADEYYETIDQLERMQAGELRIPGIARYEGIPAAMQTPIIDQRYRANKLRVDGAYSTDTTIGKPFYNPASLYEWH